MNRLFPLLILGLLLASLFPNAEAAPGPAAGECEIYRHQAVVAVIGLVTVGDNEAWSQTPGCGIARSNTQTLAWAGHYSGPVLTGVATFTWTASGPFVGCTSGAIAVVNAQLAAFSGSAASALITMTSNECHGYYVLAVAVAPAYVWTTAFPINIRVEQPNHFILCGADGLTANTYNPSGSQCTVPQIDNQNHLCPGGGFTTTCTDPTFNTGGSTTITGTFDVTPCSTARLAADPNACRVDNNPLSTQGLNSTPTSGWWLELFFWLAVFWFIMRHRNLFMLVFALGGVLHLVNPAWFFGLQASLPWLAVGALLDILMKTLKANKEEKRQRSMT